VAEIRDQDVSTITRQTIVATRTSCWTLTR